MKEGKNNFKPMNLEILVNVSRIRTFHGRHGLLHICFKFSVLACPPPAVISPFYDDGNDLWSVGIELESNITQTTAVVVQQGGLLKITIILKCLFSNHIYLLPVVVYDVHGKHKHY